MMIEIHISSILHEKIPNLGKNLKKDNWELPEGTNIQNVLEMLTIGDIPTILMVNGRQANSSKFLSDGDILKVFVVLAGG